MRYLPAIFVAFVASAQTPEVQRLLDQSDAQNKQQHFDLAVQAAQQAVDLSRATSDKKGLAHAYWSLTSADYNWRRLDEAFGAAKQCETVASEIGDSADQISCLNLAGSSLRDQGKLDEALAIYNRALDAEKSAGDRTREANTLRMLSVVYRMTGDYGRAVPLAQRSLDIGRELKDPKLEVTAHNVLGVLEFEQKRFEPALQQFRAGLDVRYADDLLRDQLLDGAAACYCELKQFDRCIEVNRQELQLALAAGNLGRAAFGYQTLATSQRLSGELQDSYETLLKALATLRSADHMTYDEIGFLQTLGEGLVLLKRSPEALPHFQEAIAIVERLRQGLVPTEQARAASVAATKPLFDETIDIAFPLDPSLALQSAELARARAFLWILAEAKVDLRHDLSASDSEREATLFAKIAGIQKGLWREDVTAAVRKQRSAELEAAEQDLERLHLEIRRSNPRLGEIQYPKPLGVEEIQRDILKPGVTLVEYHLDKDQSLVWAISRDRMVTAVLPPAKEIETLAGAYRRSLTAEVSGLTARQAEAESARLAGQLYAMLVKPIEASLEHTESLIVVPDGILYYVPFETLRSAGSSRYLVERFPISYAPSATSLKASEMPAPAVRQKALLAFGDPSYARSAAKSSPDLEPLPFTREEVNGIASLFPKAESAVYLGVKATPQAVKAETLDGYRYIHFAAHGILDEAHPSRSGLALTAGPNSDGVLRVDEVTALRVHADVVTLSACGTGLGELVSGEGMLGLVRSFLYAGASSVAVSLWNVSDDATSALMKEFYRNLSKQLPPQEAMRRARLSLIHSDNSLWHHPHFWAPFVLWLR